MWEQGEEGCCGKKGTDPSALARGVGLVTEGEWNVLVLTLCPTGRRAVFLCPSLTVSHSLN